MQPVGSFFCAGQPVRLFLAATTMIAAIVGRVGAPILGIERAKRKTLFAVVFAVATAMGVSCIVIGMEWGHGHPWPEWDVAYVVTAMLRCGLLGVVLGYAVAAVMSFPMDGFIPSIGRRGERIRLTHVAMAFVVIATTCAVWWPVWPYYQQQLTLGHLVAEIDLADTEAIARRVPSVRRLGAQADAISLASFRAIHGRDERVRMAALETLKLLGDEARATPLLELTLKEMLKDQKEAVRAAAADYLSFIKAGSSI
jgi:hypothetical protein